MADSMIETAEAATLLGMTPDEVSKLVNDGDLRGFRAGASIRIRMSDLEQYALDNGITLGGNATSNSDVNLDEDDGDEGSVLVSEEELGGAGGPRPSTIIGRRDPDATSDDSDLSLAGDSDLSLAGDSDLTLSNDESSLNLDEKSESILSGDDSDLTLGNSSILGGGSELNLAADSSLGARKPGSDVELGDDDEDSDIGLGSDINLVPDVMGSGVNLVAGDSDLNLGSSGALDSSLGGSALGSAIGDNELLLGDDLDDDADDLPVGDSELMLSNDASDVTLGDSELSLSTDASDLTLGDSELSLSSEASDIGTNDSGLSLSGDASDLTLGDSELSLGESDFAMGGSAIGSSIDSDIGAESEIDLSIDDDDELVLGGSGVGSDLSLGAGDSGINLNPTDSGLSLEEEPLELGGSAVDMLELPEDDEMITLDQDSATQLRQDEEFLLTPVEDEFDEEESGSQVIALEDSVGYIDPASATMLGSAEPAPQEQQLVAEEPDIFGQQGPGGTAQPLAPVQAPVVAADPQVPYSIWNVASLMCVMLLLMVTGMLMVDMMRNLWSFDEPISLSSSLMDSIVKALSLDP